MPQTRADAGTRQLCARHPIPKRLRFAVLARDEFRCVYCGTPAAEAQIHVDHIKPVAAGGKTVATNLATSCADCNLGKSDLRYRDLPVAAAVEMPSNGRKKGRSRGKAEYRTFSWEEWDSLSELDAGRYLMVGAGYAVYTRLLCGQGG